MATAPFDSAGRTVITGSKAVGASTSGVLATFTLEANEGLIPVIASSSKSVAYLICYGPSGIPADEELRICVRRTTNANEYQLVWANGLEGCTIKYGVLAIAKV